MSAQPRLILIEGIPGSGKTTAAGFVERWLAGRGIPAAVFLEGNPDHPADFEAVACLDEQEYGALQAQFRAHAAFLEKQATVDGNERFFRYRHLEKAYPHLPAALIQVLARYEVYELAAEKYQRLLRQRWQRFALSAAAAETTFVFECALLQNPLTMMLGRHDEAVAAAQAFVLELAGLVRPLAPRWLYLQLDDVRARLVEVAQTRPREWLDFVIAYHTQQGHGKRQGWQGFEGLVRFYEKRQAIELDLLPQLPFPGLLAPHSNWAAVQEQIAAFLADSFSG